ncbi:MAG: hypothetical protein MJZ84_03815 [Paludibacteraceae bacterium]|nr:hypothetical protein [Paludibacteraceae bacterium]
MKKFFFISTIALIVCSCQEKTNFPWTDTFRDNLKGPVAKVETFGYDITDILPNGDFIAKPTSNHYANGPLSEGSGYVVDEYDAYGRKYYHSMEGRGDVKITWDKFLYAFELGSKWPFERNYFNMKGEHTSTVIGIKDKNGEYTEEVEYDMYGNKIALYFNYFNQAGLCTYHCRASLDHKPFYKYDYQYDEEGRLESGSYENCYSGFSPSIYEIEYKNGVRKAFNVMQGGEIYQTYAANKHGDWTEFVDGNIVYKKYDKKGNWEVRIIYDVEGNPVNKEVRVITYSE